MVVRQAVIQGLQYSIIVVWNDLVTYFLLQSDASYPPTRVCCLKLLAEH